MSKSKAKSIASRTLRIMVVCALMCALSIVLGKYLAINITDVFRLSFENLPIIFAGLAFGPIAGMACGAVADLVGCLMVGYAINPIITVGAATVGLVSGFFTLFPKTHRGVSLFLKVFAFALAAHTLGSVIIKTIGLAAFYSWPLYLLMLWRALIYLFIGTVESVLIFFLIRNKRIASEINKITQRTR